MSKVSCGLLLCNTKRLIVRNRRTCVQNINNIFTIEKNSIEITLLVNRTPGMPNYSGLLNVRVCCFLLKVVQVNIYHRN